ncbi:MAG: DUF1585 domain-containing protein [Myxococcota bacterium]
MLWALALACRTDEPLPEYVPLDPVGAAVRASMALRGVRPTEAELRRVRAFPELLPVLVDGWLADPRFADTVGDFYAEVLQMRADVLDPLPPLGPLEGVSLAELDHSLNEAPLELARSIVREHRPITDLVTAEATLADPIVAAAYGLPYDPDGPTWQPVVWPDGRPMAGILSDSAIWRRHESANSNFNRTRANLLADALLCADFASRDVAVSGTNLADGLAIAEVLATDPSCIACHVNLDPLAAHLWGVARLHRWDTVVTAYEKGCSTAPKLDEYTGNPFTMSEMCYPLVTYQPEFEGTWANWDLPPPAYYGAPSGDLRALGANLAEDPRFATCTARRLYAYLSRTDPEALPSAAANTFAEQLVDSGYDLAALARAVVLSDSFLAIGPAEGADPPIAPAGVVPTRPEQLARLLEDVTGFTWSVAPDPVTCGDGPVSTCWGEVDLLRSDRFGFRAMAGGADGFNLLRPIATPTPERELVWQQVTAEAAARVVRSDLATADPATRRLLRGVNADTTDRGVIQDQIAALAPTVFGQLLDRSDPVVVGLTDLWQADHARRADPEAAWTVVLVAMLQDPWVEFH